ncbi:3-hydroxyacid dehydrogenase/reductase [Niveomyces insectorum RCEF 264]|uniref:3-hydroxyacid dehydrogenase/reductase n=1 Tax=Niveomyces insectorum RCEF 264 TaxID=1081102 RepID=A0A167MNY4_9HYPO|nr:3-hydroxyacid dehydrogenase/reductase [Niveomyces insectorum RCEF 264]
MSTLKVGVAGLGAMGGGMARHLLKKEFHVTGYDVYPPSVDKLVEAGGVAARTAAEAAENVDVLLVMVITPAQVSTVLFGDGTNRADAAAARLPANAAVVISSTVPPQFCHELRQRLDDEVKRPDVYLLDCPVSGGTPRAADGTLSIFGSGPADGLAKAQPVLAALSAVLYTIPGGIGSGSKAKMCHQVLPEAEIALANEVMALAARAGLNTQTVFDAVQAGEGASWINGNRIPHMLEGDKTVFSAVPNSQKDSSIIVNHSRTVHFPVFLVATAEQVYQASIHAGWAKDDDSTIWRLYLPDRAFDYIHQCTKRSDSDSDGSGKGDAITVRDIVDIFAGAHLATAAEAMGFTEASGLDTTVMYDIISKAAGSNWQFVENVPRMKKPTWSLRDVPSAPEVGRKLRRALAKANAIGASLPVATAALQLFQLHLGAF